MIKIPVNLLGYFLITARPSNSSQSRSGRTFKLVFHAPSIVGIFIPKSFAMDMNALISLGKHEPPKPNLPSGPGTCKCESPIL